MARWKTKLILVVTIKNCFWGCRVKDPLIIALMRDNDKQRAVDGIVRSEEVKQWQRGHQQGLEPLAVETTFRVRYAETDQMGIVHHASYVVWLEEGRSQWMRAHGNSYAQFEKAGLLLVVSELYLRYKQPARYDQRVTVRCWVESVRSRQIQFNYEVVDAETGAVFVEGYTQHICLDRQGRVTRIPDRWTAFLRQGAPATVSVSEHI
jgi:acyl-CoA thioester hydrolase